MGIRTLQNWKEYATPKLTNEAKKTFVRNKSVIEDRYKILLTSHLLICWFCDSSFLLILAAIIMVVTFFRRAVYTFSLNCSVIAG